MPFIINNRFKKLDKNILMPLKMSWCPDRIEEPKRYGLHRIKIVGNAWINHYKEPYRSHFPQYTWIEAELLPQCP